jgi:uncharacterized protein YndB with AHSA1/START domain
MSNDTIVKTIVLNATPETVWEFLTDKDKLREWFHPAKESLTNGKPYALVDDNSASSPENMCWGEVKAMEAPSMLQYTFTVKPLSGAMTTVTWELEAVHGGTKLTMTHKGVGAAAGDAAFGLLSALDKGWDEHFAKLRVSVAQNFVH